MRSRTGAPGTPARTASSRRRAASLLSVFNGTPAALIDGSTDGERGADAHTGDPLGHGLVAGPGQRRADCRVAHQPGPDLVAPAARLDLELLVTQLGHRAEIQRLQL